MLLPTARDGHRCFSLEGERLGVGQDGITCHSGNASQVVLSGSALLLDVPVGVLGGVGATPMEFPARSVTVVALDWLPWGESGGLNLTLMYACCTRTPPMPPSTPWTWTAGGSACARPGYLMAVVALAVDSVRDNVYWADSSRGTVEVASVDGRLRRLIADLLRHVTARQGCARLKLSWLTRL